MQTKLSQPEKISLQAYNDSLIRWSQGIGGPCQMPCQTSSLSLKIIYEEDLVTEDECPL